MRTLTLTITISSRTFSSTEEDEEAQLLALAEQLRAPMAAHGTHLRRHARDAILPAVQRVKDVHAAIDDKGAWCMLWG